MFFRDSMCRQTSDKRRKPVTGKPQLLGVHNAMDSLDAARQTWERWFLLSLCSKCCVSSCISFIMGCMYIFMLYIVILSYIIYIILYYIHYSNSYIQSLDIKNAIIYNPSIYIYIPPCSDAAGGVRAPGVATLRASSLSLAPSAAITAEAPGETETGGGLMGWLLIYYDIINIITCDIMVINIFHTHTYIYIYIMILYHMLSCVEIGFSYYVCKNITWCRDYLLSYGSSAVQRQDELSEECDSLRAEVCSL